MGDRAQKVGAEGQGANNARLPVHAPGRNVCIFDISQQEIRDFQIAAAATIPPYRLKQSI
jgi:hypothetical protein